MMLKLDKVKIKKATFKSNLRGTAREGVWVGGK